MKFKKTAKAIGLMAVFVTSLMVGVIAAQAQSCPDIGCDIIECYVHGQWTTGFYLVALVGHDDTLIRGSCPQSCFFWSCPITTMANNKDDKQLPCKRSSDDLGVLAFVDRQGSGLLRINAVYRKDVPKIESQLSAMIQQYGFTQLQSRLERQKFPHDLQMVTIAQYRKIQQDRQQMLAFVRVRESRFPNGN